MGAPLALGSTHDNTADDASTVESVGWAGASGTSMTVTLMRAVTSRLASPEASETVTLMVDVPVSVGVKDTFDPLALRPRSLLSPSIRGFFASIVGSG